MTVLNTRALAILCLATLAAGRATAQQEPADVTFAVPINLTRLPSDLTKIAVTCELTSTAFKGKAHASTHSRTGEVEIQASPAAGSQGPVFPREIIQTVQVTVPVTASDLDNPSGKQATYSCRLKGYDQSRNRWQDLHYTSNSPAVLNGPDAIFVLTPKPTPITGSFVW
jgi:hypothetical protein